MACRASVDPLGSHNFSSWANSLICKYYTVRRFENSKADKKDGEKLFEKNTCESRELSFLLLERRPAATVTYQGSPTMVHTVGEDNLLDNVRNGADGRRADMSDRKPVKNTYADITRKGVQRKQLESVRMALLSLSRINPIVRTV
jgi:hypothetical protein